MGKWEVGISPTGGGKIFLSKRTARLWCKYLIKYSGQKGSRGFNWGCHIHCRGYKWAEHCRHSFIYGIEWTALSVHVDISALFLPLWEFCPTCRSDVCCKRLRIWSSDAAACFRGDLTAAERLSAKSNSDTVCLPSHSAGSHQTDRYTNKTSHHHRTGTWISAWHSSANCRLTTDAAK